MSKMTNQPISEQELEVIKSDYRNIFQSDNLSEEQEKRLEDILKIAVDNELVDFWISHITCQEGMKKGLGSEDNIESKKTLLLEYLGTSFFQEKLNDSEGDEVFVSISDKNEEPDCLLDFESCDKIIPYTKDISFKKVRKPIGRAG